MNGEDKSIGLNAAIYDDHNNDENRYKEEEDNEYGGMSLSYTLSQFITEELFLAFLHDGLVDLA